MYRTVRPTDGEPWEHQGTSITVPQAWEAEVTRATRWRPLALKVLLSFLRCEPSVEGTHTGRLCAPAHPPRASDLLLTTAFSSLCSQQPRSAAAP